MTPGQDVHLRTSLAVSALCDLPITPVSESGRPVQDTVASGAQVGRRQRGGWKFQLGHAWALQQPARMEGSARFHFCSKNDSRVANAPLDYQLNSPPLAVASALLLPASKHSKLLPTMVPTFSNQSDKKTFLTPSWPTVRVYCSLLYGLVSPDSPSTLGHAGCVCVSLCGGWTLTEH